MSWTPPFCVNDAPNHLTCPVCQTLGSVRVRELESYCDGSEVDAYCVECHADLEVQAQVEITFSDPQVLGIEDDAISPPVLKMNPCPVCCARLLNRQPGSLFVSGPAGGGHFERCDFCKGEGEVEDKS